LDIGKAPSLYYVNDIWVGWGSENGNFSLLYVLKMSKCPYVGGLKKVPKPPYVTNIKMVKKEKGNNIQLNRLLD
jgi:hypothetical protein